MNTDSAKLMHSRESADSCIVLDNHVPGQGCRIGHNDVIAENTIMSDMCVDHEEIVIPNQGTTAALGRTTVHRDIFSEYVVITHHQLGIFPMVLEVLRRKPDGAIRKKLAVVADPRAPLNHYMRAYPAALSHSHMIADNGVGPHRHSFSKLRLRADHGSGMHFHHSLRSTIEDRISASATSLSPTKASPLNLPCRDRIRSTSTTMRNCSPGTTGWRNLA